MFAHTSKTIHLLMHAHLIHKRVSNKEMDDFAINNMIHIQNVTWIVKLKGGWVHQTIPCINHIVLKMLRNVFSAA